MSEVVATAFWKRQDAEGHDACCLMRRPDGWRLSGSAVFLHQGKACSLAYRVDCDARWHTQAARVDGSVGFEKLAFDIRRVSGGEWLLDGVAQPAAMGQIDLDLGFTPATNLIAIRRLDPRPGAETPAPAAYYLEFTRELGLLHQSYHRLSDTRLTYAAPTFGYSAELTVSPVGFVTDYPGLWSGTVAAA